MYNNNEAIRTCAGSGANFNKLEVFAFLLHVGDTNDDRLLIICVDGECEKICKLKFFDNFLDFE